MANALTGNFGPLAAIGYVQEQGDIGRQRGQQNRLNMLTGQAYSATTPQDQSSLLGQIAQISPQAAQAQQQQFQSQEDRNRKELYGLAQGWKKIPSQYRQNYYDRFLSPRLSAMGMGEQPAYDEASIDGAADQIIAAFGQNLGTGQGVQSTYVDEGGNRVAIMRDGSTQVLGRNDAGANQQTLTIDVNGTPTQVTFDRRTGRYTNANLGAPQRPLQQIDGQPTYIDPSLPPQVQAAIRAGAGTNLQDGGQLQVAQGMPLVGRRKEDEAAATEAARLAVQQQYLPSELAARTQAALAQEAGKAQVSAQADANKLQTTRSRDANTALDLLDDAQAILNSGATGSLIGAGADRLAGAFGRSTQGAQATAALQTIAGQLTSKMPRMEGPQSDRDVQLYKQMAGDLANDTLPVQTRLAALEQIRSLNRKYANRQPSTPREQGAPRQIQSAADYNALPSGALFIAPDGTQRRKR